MDTTPKVTPKARRYVATRIADANWGVVDTERDEYVTAWRPKQHCVVIADVMHIRFGDTDYRDVLDVSDPDEIRVVLDDMLHETREG